MFSTLRSIAVVGLAAAVALASTGAAAQDGKTEILWFGQSAMRIKTVTGKVIVIDPWLAKNSKAPPEYKNLDKIGKTDIILVTHAHVDHVGDGPDLAKKYNAPL